MGMVGGLDLHRRQITFDVVELESGEEWRGRVWQPDRDRFRRWLRDDVTRRANGGSVMLAVEGCTGWRYVVEEIEAAGFEAHLAEPADTQAARGPQASSEDRSQRRAVAARSARGRRAARELDPTRAGVGVARTRAAVRVVGEPAHGVVSTHPRRAVSPRRRGPGGCDPHGQDPGDARRRDAAALAGGAGTDRGWVSDDRRDRSRGPAAQAGVATLRCPSTRVPRVGRRAIRDRRPHRGGGVDRARRLPTVPALRTSRAPHRPRCHRRLLGPATRAGGFLSRQGPETLRWALYEAAKNSSHHRSPDHQYYTAVKERHDGKIAAISVARQFARRCYHVLRNLDPDIVYAMPN